MAKMNVQFHATLEDIYDFIVDMFSRKYIIKGIIIFPEFEIHDITEDIIMEDIKSYDIFCISKYEIIDVKSYKEFCKKYKIEDNPKFSIIFLALRNGSI